MPKPQLISHHFDMDKRYCDLNIRTIFKNETDLLHLTFYFSDRWDVDLKKTVGTDRMWEAKKWLVGVVGQCGLQEAHWDSLLIQVTLSFFFSSSNNQQ